MERITKRPTIKGSADWFSGDVYVDKMTVVPQATRTAVA